MKADASGTVSAKVTSGKVLFSAWEAGSKLESKEMTINSNRAIRLELNQTTDSYGFIYRKTGEALNAIYVIPEALAPKAAVFEGPAGMKPQAVGKGHFLFTQEVGDKTQIDWSPLLEGEASKGLYYAFSIPVEGEISGQARIYQGEGRSIGNLPEAPLTDEERAILPDSVLAAVGDVVAPFGRVDVLDLVDFLNYWKGVYQAKYDLGSIVAMEFARPNGTPPQPFNASTLVKDSAVNVYDLLVMLNGYHLATTEIANFTNINKPFPVTNVNAVLAGAGYNVIWTIQHAGDVQEGFDIYVGNTPGALTTYLGTAAPTALSYAISGTAHTGKYVSVVANNAPYYSETAVGPALPSSGGGVVVTSVNYVDLTTFEINFSGAVDSVGIANVSVSVGVITNVVLDGAKTKATVTVTGLPYGAVVTVNVTNVMAGAFLVPNYTGSFSTPPVTDFYELVLTCNAPDNTIPSDGLSSTQLTATLYDKITGLPVTTLAEIRFSATLGSLSQSSVGLSGSSASTQLRSVSSPTPLISVVRAKLQSSTVMPQIVGLESNPLNVQFTLDGEPVKVRAESAGAPTGDRFWVEFSGAITPQQYKSIVLDPGWSADIPYGVLYIPNSGSPAVRYPMHILDVIQGGNPKRLMFILDSDHFEPRLPMNERSMAPGVSNAEDSWLGFIPSVVPGGGITKQYRLLDYSYTFMQHDPLGPSVGNFLRDNVNHTIVFPEEITDIIEKSNPITFQFSDVTEPVVGGVTPTDNCNLVVMFSEPVCETLAETPKEKDDNPHFTIDGRQLYFVTTPVAADINYAASASKILITDLHVGKYDPITGVDERTKVFIKIYPDDQFKLAPGEHILQIHNVGDWAGWTDVAQNRITTQSYAFRIDADTQLPMVEVTRQSPEQFLIKFNRKVKIEAGRNLNEALIIETPTLPPNAKIVANMVANSMGTPPE
ncbi:MAG TPA: hypothetical protein PLP59_12465, partial [Thermotogota bacterium]|nr:hypothetical protein [Thermotogota bacterium]